MAKSSKFALGALIGVVAGAALHHPRVPVVVAFEGRRLDPAGPARGDHRHGVAVGAKVRNGDLAAGERGSDLEKIKAHGPPKIVETKTDFPFVVISPQCADRKWWEPAAVIALVASGAAKGG